MDPRWVDRSRGVAARWWRERLSIHPREAAALGLLALAYVAMRGLRSPGGPPPLPEPAHVVLDVNRATAEELAALPGLGPRHAARVVERRALTGGFERVEDLLLVPGIGPERFGKVRKYLVAGPRGGAER